MSKRLFALTITILAQVAFVQAQELHYFVIEDIAAPFQMQHKDGTHSGIISDVVFALRDHLGVDIETTVAPTKRIELTLSKPTDFDWITYDAPAWNSLEQGEMLPEPLFEVHHAALHCPELVPDQLFNDKPAFAIIKGFRYPELSSLESQNKLSLIPVRDYEKGFELVDLKRATAFIEMAVRIKYKMSISQHDHPCEEITNISEVIRPYWIHIAVNKNMAADKKDGINNAIIELKSKGIIKDILQRYGAH